MIQELQTRLDLRFNLVSSAKYMGIILLEAADSRKTREGAADLVSMQDTEICKSNRQFLIGVSVVFEHEAMAWAVHRL